MISLPKLLTQSGRAPLSFEALVRVHQGMIRAFLRRLTGDAAMADDLAQEAFIKAHAQIDRLNSTDAAKAWLFQIAYHCYIDYARKEARRRSLTEAGGVEAGPDAMPAPSGVKMDIEMAMETLPTDQRAIIMMCLSYGMSHSEAARASGLPIGTVKSHIKRGRAHLQDCLVDYAPKRLG